MPSRVCEPAVSNHGSHSIVPPVRWYRSFRQARLNRPALAGTAAFWLQAEGSLTRHLQLRCRQRFHVEVAHEGFCLPTREEALTLGIPHRQRAWIREVRLCGDGTPWVLARTIIPLDTLSGRGRRLRHLGRVPLGAWLFSHREWSRGPLQTGLCHPVRPGDPRCARRSIFSNRDHRLLVGEYFLPELLARPL
ncbi:chorismate--pyruvate lyase family protein [Marinobacter zhanjiangensis]|uniref:chorismate--pyruvate lyase family protein n=1 Tax=Marinobacter zhanjiangensis TaxID=578215 RepID=UPI001674A268|nr:chorismate lyase [Marinobacter zhanjiangensis]